MVAITRKGNTRMARLYESEDRRTKVRTKRKRATAMMPERTGDSAHEATIAETPCSSGSFIFFVLRWRVASIGKRASVNNSEARLWTYVYGIDPCIAGVVDEGSKNAAKKSTRLKPSKTMCM